ncbi:MAG: homocysteine S-methyltransferase family protein [Spirochaetes bacterium]|nr:homocysteine S-methyltransferase family protein [Spirochaetota bacterium]
MIGDNPAAAQLRSLFGGRLILADGSTGTALEALAPEAAASGRSALLPLENPDIVEALHDAYFEAGADLVETATFSGSAFDLERFAEGYPGSAEGLSYAVNKAAAEAACRAARRAATKTGATGAAGLRPRLVAGSIGPGDKPPSLGAASYAQLRASYLPQARGLADGGADLAIIETCQDPLQIKAAIAALRSPEGGRGLPFIVSATVDEKGRMLAGTDIAAFVAIVTPFAPLALGLNCSGGPDEIAPSLETLAALSPFPLCFMPNAGIPSSVKGCTTYPFGPEVFSKKVETLTRRYAIAIAGGCCGTTPSHIAALHRRLSDRPAAGPRPPARPSLASLYRARYFGPGLFKIGERANSAGSAAFAALLDADDFEAMADKALLQEKSGASALDLHLSRAGRDEAGDLEQFAALIAPRAQAALSLDSSDPEVLAGVLPFMGGRPLLNSTSLEDLAKTRHVFALAREFGAAVVCLALDGSGPARGVEDKVRICRSLYSLAVGEFGLAPSSLLFDPLTFTIAAGGDAGTTIAAIPAVKAACPGSLTVLGVGNISYGLPKSTRSAVTSLFLDAAVKAGLDAAIVDTAGIPAPETIEPDLKAAACKALNLEKRDGDSADPLDALLAWAANKTRDGKGAPRQDLAGQAGESEPQDPVSKLKAALSRGDGASAETTGKQVVELKGGAALMTLVTESMAESGRLWNEGLLSLPLVLRSAEAAKRALLPLAGAFFSETKGSVVMATVKGDLHDIGKNIVAAILACSGWKVVDLGTDASADSIVRAAQESGALAVGLSGLLTRSLAEMRLTCETLEASGSGCLVLCGGAAVSADFVEREIEPLHPGLVQACPDAFAAAKLLDEEAAGRIRSSTIKKALRNTTRGAMKGVRDARKATATVTSSQGGRAERTASGTPIETKGKPAYKPPFLGASEPCAIPFGELLESLRKPLLFTSRWGYKRKEFKKAEAELARLLSEAETLASPSYIYGYFPVQTGNATSLLVGAGGDPGEAWAGLDAKPFFELPFPRENGGLCRTLASYFRPEGDYIAFFAATAGPGLGRRAKELKELGRLEAYWHLHGLGSALAEAAAQWAHDRIGTEIRAAGGQTKGKRYSFGFPSCPGLEFQAPLLELLGASRIGLSATSGHQLDPEHSVTAFIIARPDAVYF